MLAGTTLPRRGGPSSRALLPHVEVVVAQLVFAKASTMSRASSSRYCTGGDFMK